MDKATEHQHENSINECLKIDLTEQYWKNKSKMMKDPKKRQIQHWNVMDLSFFGSVIILILVFREGVGD